MLGDIHAKITNDRTTNRTWKNKITIIVIISRIIVIISNAGISTFTIIESYGVVSSIVAVDSSI